MLTVRDEQLRRLDEELEKATLLRFAARLRRECPAQLLPPSEGELHSQIRDGYRAARGLRITAEEDAYRFLRLRYHEADALASEAVRHAFYKIMSDLQLDATRRLDFVERHVFGLPPR